MGNGNNPNIREKHYDNIKEYLKQQISNEIDSSFEKFDFNKKEQIKGWTLHIIEYIKGEVDKIINNFTSNQKTIQVKEIDNAKNFNRFKNLNYITSKNVQDENLEITRNFQTYAMKLVNDNDNKENETIGKFCANVAKISKQAYIVSNSLLENYFFDYYNNVHPKINSLEQDQLKKEFSSYIKELEENKDKEKKYSIYNFIRNPISTDGKNESIILNDLYYQLILLYFHCQLSFPPVNINYKLNDDNFDSQKMIDFINKGRGRKVNFVILPSLYSNGCYIENGKYYVFTYKNNTFRYTDLNIDSNQKEDNIFIIPSPFELLEFKLVFEQRRNNIIVLYPKTNMEISDKLDIKITICLFNKKQRYQQIYILTPNKNELNINEFQFKYSELIIENKPVKKCQSLEKINENNNSRLINLFN